MTDNTPTETETETETDRETTAETVHVVTYFDRYHEDGFELGGVYRTPDEATAAADTRECAEYEWASYAVTERAIGGGN